MTIDEVIALLEESPGPDIKLDVMITALVEPGWEAVDGSLTLRRWSDKCAEWHYKYPPKFTNNIQLARDLSSWILLQASDIGADGLAVVVLGNPDTSPAGEVRGIHACLEIAWCIASLKAIKADRA
ncbi:MAG: hypothetical protein LPL29_13385 [Alphaproteobacteria bacterium]|nr:hypothetical protein [Alphaproteobacteria bacterium]